MLVTKLSVAACTFFTLCLAGQVKRTTIDGSQTPEMIPDAEAYQMMFLTLSDGKASLSRGARLNYLAPSGLSEAEMEIVLDASNQFAIYADSVGQKYKSLIEQRKAGSISQDELSARIRWVYDAAKSQLKEMISSLEAELGSSASTKLLALVRTKVKRSMTYTGSPK